MIIIIKYDETKAVKMNRILSLNDEYLGMQALKL